MLVLRWAYRGSKGGRVLESMRGIKAGDGSEITETWSHWIHEDDGNWTKWRIKGNYVHGLFAKQPGDYGDRNHYHLKFTVTRGPTGGLRFGTQLLCSIKENGVLIINRGELLQKIGAITGNSYPVDPEPE